MLLARPGIAQVKDGSFVVISGDALTDLNLTEMVRFHKQQGAPFFE